MERRFDGLQYEKPLQLCAGGIPGANPCILARDGQRFRKGTAYVFNFDPARTLIIFDEFANNLSADTVGGQGTSDDRKENIKRLLNFSLFWEKTAKGKWWSWMRRLFCPSPES